MKSGSSKVKTRIILILNKLYHKFKRGVMVIFVLEPLLFVFEEKTN